ncbi:MAG: DUF721 domain-containing protein [Bacteroidaceae bacterium]|nr:DUF721 domain-containing protein [Bacteroidaceae bacterium]
MKRTKAIQFGDVLQQYLRMEGLETPLNEFRLVNEAWPEVVGHGVARYTTNIEIHNQTLFVRMTSPALRQNLSMMRSQLIKKLNAYVGAQVIVNIVFS